MVPVELVERISRPDFSDPRRGSLLCRRPVQTRVYVPRTGLWTPFTDPFVVVTSGWSDSVTVDGIRRDTVDRPKGCLTEE